MAITPSSDLYLLKCPLEVSGEHQMTFANYTAQVNYFSGLPHIAADNFSYIRADSVIRYPAHIDSIRNYNYVMYRNENYSNKWFFAYIENMEYQNDGMTYIKIKTDVWQTWQFDLTFKKSYVVREHVNNDVVGAHTIPEGLEYGEYVVNGYASTTYNARSSYIIVAQVSDLPPKLYDSFEPIPTQGNAPKRIYNGIPSGCWYVGFNTSREDSYNNFNRFVRMYDVNNMSDAIISVGIAPTAFTGTVIETSIPDQTDKDGNIVAEGFDCFRIPTSNAAVELETDTWTRNATIDGYTPKNNKLFCSPYNYLMITNNSGSTVSYAWEDFSSSDATFKLRGALSQGCDVKLTPENYKKTDLWGGYQWSISGAKLPMLSWNSDFYLNWYAVNGKNIEIQAGLAAGNWGLNMIGSMLSGNVGGMLTGTMNLASQTASLAQQTRAAEMVPDSAKGNINSGDLNWTLSKDCLTGYKMSIKAEYARTIDEYFSMYGYKINRNKVPALNSRQNWNYIQTLGCNIVGDIPQEDMDEIKGLFDRGITLWHNSSNFLNYDVSNNIV